MAVTSTPKINSVFKRIVSDFLSLTFEEGDNFHWSASRRIITHPEISELDDLYQLLHEVGHANLNHDNYRSDAELIDMELAAWNYAAKKLAPRYGLTLSVDDDIVQDSLDSYREWLHARSTCPECGSVGIEEAADNYSCFACRSKWSVNEARSCQLRRYKKQNTPN